MVEDVTELGRLTAFGVRERWQAALLLPRRWHDLTAFSAKFPPVETLEQGGVEPVMVVRVAEPPKHITGRGAPRTVVAVTDESGNRGYATFWGDAHPITAQLRLGGRSVLRGRLRHWRGTPQLTVAERIHPRWLNRAMPVYPGKPGVIGATKTRERVIALLVPAVPEAAAVLGERLAAFGDAVAVIERAGGQGVFADFEALLWQAHLPDSPAVGAHAQAVLERLAALALLACARAESRQAPARPLALSLTSRSRRCNALPFALTDDQLQALDEVTEDLRRPVAMHRLLTGDVGSGKTAVYATAVAMAADAGACAAVLVPNIALAAQIHQEFRSYWPDIDARLVAAHRAEDAATLREATVVIGTTALLNVDLGERDLVVVDEQHKFSRAQREQLAGAHLLEVSATCIPRSQALLSFGVVDLSRLTASHADKRIHTRVHGPTQRRALFRACLATVRDGGQVALVYPTRENAAAANPAGMSATAAAQAWERNCPGRVRLVHGQMTDATKQAVLGDMRDDRADVLVTTTVIELGLTLVRLRRVVVVDAPRHGLTTLHQLRGRIARHGGEGYFDLLLVRQCGDDVRQRLACLEQSDDGFELAEMDLRLRGYGELTGTSQHGDGNALVLGRRIDHRRLAEMAETLVGLGRRVEPVEWVDSMERLAERYAEELRLEREAMIEKTTRTDPLNEAGHAPCWSAAFADRGRSRALHASRDTARAGALAFAPRCAAERHHSGQQPPSPAVR